MSCSSRLVFAASSYLANPLSQTPKKHLSYVECETRLTMAAEGWRFVQCAEIMKAELYFFSISFLWFPGSHLERAVRHQRPSRQRLPQGAGQEQQPSDYGPVWLQRYPTLRRRSGCTCMTHFQKDTVTVPLWVHPRPASLLDFSFIHEHQEAGGSLN